MINKNTEILLEVLNRYKRWIREGKPKNNAIHDPYHDYIKELEVTEDLETYEFNIQTYDSPEGDIWWKGVFTFNVSTGEIEILEQKSYTN